MVAALDPFMKATLSFSPRTGPGLFHGWEKLPRFETLAPEQLSLNSKHTTWTSCSAASPPMAHS